MLLEATATTTQTLIREISADLETPISVYMKLRGDGASFLLESVEGGERIARYSFIGIKPKAQYIIRGNEIEVIESDSTRVVTLDENVDPTYFLQEEISRFKFTSQVGVPRFIGGLVGYLGYESVRYFEPTLKSHMNRAHLHSPAPASGAGVRAVQVLRARRVLQSPRKLGDCFVGLHLHLHAGASVSPSRNDAIHSQ
jgi:Anthranilate synthase component I, N terminal region